MAKYPGRLITSFLLYSAAFCIIFIMALLDGWYIISGGYSFHFSGRSSRFDSYYQNYYSSSIYTEYYNYYIYYTNQNRSGMTTAMYILLFTSVGFTGLCVLLSFIMMCADCCCRITKCMIVIPKITTGFGQVAGMLAEAACVVFLVKIYATESPKDILQSQITVVPYYCFYLVAVAGMLLMIAGCINCGVKHATRVEDSGEVVNVVPVSYGVQSQAAQQQQMMYMSGINPATGLQFYQPPQTAFANQAYYPGNGAYPPKVLVTHIFTQTSESDLKKSSKK